MSAAHSSALAALQGACGEEFTGLATASVSVFVYFSLSLHVGMHTCMFYYFLLRLMPKYA